VPAVPVEPLGEDFAYVQVVTDLKRRIASGELSGKLPSERSLAEEYECAYTTVRRAMEVLRDEGTVITRQGRGTFVR
jgi:DNA-binding GntR family transcriptional regulator